MKITQQEAEQAVTTLLKYVGEDTQRDGLVRTPYRVVKALKEMTQGYTQHPEQILKRIFPSNANQMIVLKDVSFSSMCEHHMLPFFGKCHIGYIPKSQVVGLSKLARLLEVYSRRLQIQEQLTNQIANSLMNVLKPIGVGVIIEAKHFCMMCRGVGKKNSVMITSAIRGIFQNSTVKNEFHRLIK